ncbi:MAG: hypothetical protein ACREL5_02260 [Gemmatimonadales bacterium]
MPWLPDVTRAPFAAAPVATFVPAPADGVLPEGFFSTSNLPTYVRLKDGWQAPVRPRMDCAVVRRGGTLEALEPRKVRQGEPVLAALDEHGAEGVVVSSDGFLGQTYGANEFQFMRTEVSRERPVNYDDLAARLRREKERHGFTIWITGPALVHARARGDFEWLIRNGYVDAVLAGNAVAVHDIEASIFGTTLGMDNAGRPTQGGHGLHMRAINAVRAAGSIENAVRHGLITSGIMHALVTTKIPFVLAGSIRDDGPLPGVITDNLDAQDAMREYTVKATAAVFVATALHAIAVGNMLPAFHTHTADGHPEPLTTICVDQTEFVVNKLRDRGTHQAYGVVTNAQDFMHILRLALDR